ncbi:MAG: hypothetical protein MJ207_03145 [Bacilli bacterium]|nr:hypothetical protein [Bacilli bacterium]
MKKLFSVLFCLIPLTFSCGKHSSLDFPNPFPNDPYKRIGRTIAPDEEVLLPISPKDLDVLARTIGDGENPSLYNKYITKCDGEIHYRSYELAFANEFRQGYDSLNQMSDTVFHSQSQGFTNEANKRAILKSSADTIKNYVYGNVAVKQEKDTYWYLHKPSTGISYPEEYNDLHNLEAWQNLEEFCVSERSKTTTNTADPKIEDKLIAKYGDGEKSKPGDPFDLFETQIMQDDYLKLPTDTPDSGITRDGHLVLVSHEDTPYGDDGIYKLNDGRKFRAVHSKMAVARLTLKSVAIDPLTPWQESWYLVDQARVYEEDSITSEEIQPNVPITDISPVTIGYTESIYHFKTEEIDQYNTDKLPDPGENNR